MENSILTDEKLYYSISEVAEYFNVSTSLIRYWETEFTFLRPHKNSKGDRRFTRANIDQIQIIFDLVKERGFTLEGAKKEIRESKKRLQTKQKLTNKLKSLKLQMEKWRDQLD
ncbi:MAG TPA: MerR family transcriptional regulator [Saprospiraceae bacterium]|nr:MerR family transcriptional regulator [Saprospiraceae bacterium]HQW55467.1 MerR family transcriptional regulator [Saprospiraceae bacterium]